MTCKANCLKFLTLSLDQIYYISFLCYVRNDPQFNGLKHNFTVSCVRSAAVEELGPLPRLSPGWNQGWAGCILTQGLKGQKVHFRLLTHSFTCSYRSTEPHKSQWLSSPKPAGEHLRSFGSLIASLSSKGLTFWLT